VKPMDFKSTPIDNGHFLDVELRIKVLTSQHEDMLFRVRIQGYNPITKEEIPGMIVLTPSIKVISKPEQLKKKQPSKKRSLTDMLVETVSRIEKKQEEQQRLIERMLQQQTDQTTTIDKKQRIDDIWVPEIHSLPERARENHGLQFSTMGLICSSIGFRYCFFKPHQGLQFNSFCRETGEYSPYH
jgi:hypothetical protein